MPAKSKKQQRLMGMALATKRGEMKGGSSIVKGLAESMSSKSLKKYAGTKTKELPTKVKKK